MNLIARKIPRPKTLLKSLPPLEQFIDATRRFPRDEWYRLIVPYPVSTNRMYRNFRGIMVLSKEGKRYKKFVGQIALACGVRPISGRVDVRIDLYRPQQSGDLDNFFKVLLDSIKGISFVDDRQVKRIIADQHEDPANPRAVVAVRVTTGETLSFEDVFRSPNLFQEAR